MTGPNMACIVFFSFVLTFASLVVTSTQELPDKPVFKVNGIQFQKSVNLYSEDEDITVTCQVRHGQQAVQSITLSCGFPITESGESQQIGKGISITIKRTGERSMDGKNCTCWGNHITGSGEKSTLHFKLSRRPTSCDDENARQSFEVQVGKEATVELCAVGYRVPDADSCSLLKENGGVKTLYSKHKYNVVYKVAAKQMVNGVEIKFKKVGPDDIGNFTLHYDGAVMVSESQLYFQLSTKASNQGLGIFLLVGIVVAANLVVSVAIILLTCCCVCKRRRDKGNNGNNRDVRQAEERNCEPRHIMAATVPENNPNVQAYADGFIGGDSNIPQNLTSGYVNFGSLNNDADIYDLINDANVYEQPTDFSQVDDWAYETPASSTIPVPPQSKDYYANTEPIDTALVTANDPGSDYSSVA